MLAFTGRSSGIDELSLETLLSLAMSLRDAMGDRWAYMRQTKDIIGLGDGRD
jgi:hypothetical protein